MKPIVELRHSKYGDYLPDGSIFDEDTLADSDDEEPELNAYQ